MGGPNNLDEVELFLTNMFNDRRIIGAPKPIRRLIARFITNRRKAAARTNYEALGGKSPIVGYTRRLVKALQPEVDAKVDFVMRYTPPFAADVLPKYADYDEIYALPLYPHYSTTTTSSSFDDLFAVARQLGIQSKIRTVERYYADPLYNQAIVARIKEALCGDAAGEFELVFSAHGLPRRVIEKGDPYQKEIRCSVYHARKALLKAGLRFKKTHLAYQSRLGPLEWIRPYLDDKLKALKSEQVIIYPIAFTIDNSETEFELDVEYRELAIELGLEDYRVAKAPNASTLFVAALKGIYETMKSGDSGTMNANAV